MATACGGFGGSGLTGGPSGGPRDGVHGGFGLGEAERADGLVGEQDVDTFDVAEGDVVQVAGDLLLVEEGVGEPGDRPRGILVVANHPDAQVFQVDRCRTLAGFDRPDDDRFII